MILRAYTWFSCSLLGLLGLGTLGFAAAAQGQDENLVVQAMPAFNDENFNQWIFQSFGNAQNARKRMEAMLAVQTDEVVRACALSNAQKEKVQLAGRGDIKRFFDRVEESRKKFQLVKDGQNKLTDIFRDIYI